MELPEVRLFLDPDGVVPPYAVVQHSQDCWYGLPGDLKTRLSDEDVKDAIPLGPASGAVVHLARNGGAFDVDINGKSAARRVSSLIAGEFIAQSALQAGAPILVVPVGKTRLTGPARMTGPASPPERPKLSVVPDPGDGSVGGQ
jgi:hypothetical protein